MVCGRQYTLKITYICNQPDQAIGRILWKILRLMELTMDQMSEKLELTR